MYLIIHEENFDQYSRIPTLNSDFLKYRIYCNKRPGAMHFSKGGATITDK